MFLRKQLSKNAEKPLEVLAENQPDKQSNLSVGQLDFKIYKNILSFFLKPLSPCPFEMVSTSLQNTSFGCCSREVQPVALMSCFSDPSLMWSDLISEIKKFHCFQKTGNHLLVQRQPSTHNFEQAHLTSASGLPLQSPCPLPSWWPIALARLQLLLGWLLQEQLLSPSCVPASHSLQFSLCPSDLFSQCQPFL